MYNITLKDFKLPVLKEIKKIAYYVKTTGTWPDPSRVNLKSMERSGEKEDAPLLIERLFINGVALVAAGEPSGKWRSLELALAARLLSLLGGTSPP